MPIYELIKEQWTLRQAPLLGARKNTVTPHRVSSTEGGKNIGGLNLVPTTWAAVQPTDQIYIPPKSASDGTSASSSSRLAITYEDRLKTVPLEASGRTLKIAVYCPKVTALPNETVQQRISRMKDALQAAANVTADIFVGPEYFFTKNTSQLNAPNSGANHTYTAEEFLAVNMAIIEMGEQHKSMLIIPGTTLWKNNANEVRNTGYVCHYLDSGRAHSKKTSHHEVEYAQAAGGQYTPGASSQYDFEFQGLRARYEICSDVGQAGNAGNGKELHIISGFTFGGGMPSHAHHGGVEILSDGGDGDGRIERPFEFKPKTATNDDRLIVSNMEVKKAANPQT